MDTPLVTPLILASASPRRRELLAQAGYRFAVQASAVTESRRPGEEAIPFAVRLAEEKAQEVFARRVAAGERVMVLGADTVVVCDGVVMGKPQDAAEAEGMLLRLSGRTHHVVTGVAVVWGSGPALVEVAAELTQVTMRTLSAEEIARYVAGGEPMDKAGGYGIQGYAARWIPRIHGCYFNVVGLPLALVSSMLEGAELRSQAV